MIWNYLKAAFRYLNKHKFFAFVNIAGLAVGLAVFILLILYIQFELSFDNFHINKDRIYRIEQVMIEGGRTEQMEGCPTPLWQALKDEFPEIEKSIRLVTNYANLLNPEGMSFGVRGFLTDNEFLDLFSFSLILGNSETALSEPNCIVLTESAAKMFFGDENPLGKMLDDNGLALKVTGVMEDPPKNSHLDFNVLFSVSTIESLYGIEEFQQWGNNWVSCYVILHPDVDITLFNSKIKNILKKFWFEETQNELYTRPLTEIHLYSEISDDYAVRSSIENIYIIFALAIFILIMAGVNYTNLTVAYSSGRTKEIGLRKVMGASRVTLLRQFLGESILIVLIGLFFGFVLFETFLPRFNHIVDRELDFVYFDNIGLFLFIICVAFILSLLAGLYPALLISKINPQNILKGNVSKAGKNPLLRKILVGIQSFISTCFIVGAIGIMSQVDYMKNKDLGYNPDDMLSIRFQDSTMNRINYFRTHILNNPGISAATVHDYNLYNSNNWTRVSWEGADEKEYIRMNDNYSDHHFLKAYEMELLEGKGFTVAQNGMSGDGNEVVLNETAINMMGISDPIGKKLLYGGDYRGTHIGGASKIVGVLKNYHFVSARNPITPMMIRLYNEEMTGWRISVRIDNQNIQQTIEFLDKKFAEIFPEQSFNYEFINDGIADLYTEEKELAGVVINLSVLAIFIACLGIFGLISFTTTVRTKEVGIRKVLGSPVNYLYALFAKEYVSLILLSSVIAYPVVYVILNNWLDNFSYKVSLGVSPFLTSTLLVLIFTLFSMAFRVLKAVRVNPVEALRYE